MAIFGGERIGGMLTIRPMLDTDSTFYDMIATPVLAAALHSHPMLDTDSAFYDFIVAPFLIAVFAFPCTPLIAMHHT
jgi:hypothetical protein